MKKLFLLLVLLLLTCITYAQNALPVGRNQLNFGIGLSEYGIPIYMGLDHALSPDFSLGGEFSIRSYTEKWDSENYNLNSVGISANGNFHFNNLLNIPSNWDFYAGLNAGFYVWNSPKGYGGSHTTGVGLDVQVGGRYYFINKVGVNFEVGGGNGFSGGKIGLSIKL